MSLFKNNALRVVKSISLAPAEGSSHSSSSSPVGAPMKILLYCASEALQDEIRESLARLAPVDEVSSAAGEISAAAAAVDRSRPDLLVLGGFDQHRALLGVVERLTGHDPKLAVIVVGRDLGSDFLIEAMRAGVREIVPHSAAHTALLEATDRVRRRMTGAPAGRARGKVLAVVSSKGGSGATFLAANLGYALAAEAGKRVILIDLNLPFGEAEIYVSDRRAAHNIGDVAQEIQRLDGALLDSMMVKVAPNFGVLATPDDPSKAAEVTSEHVERIIDVAAREFDYVLLDVNGRLDQTTVRALDKADEIIVVMQDTVPFVRGAQRLISLFRTLGYGPSKVRLLVNRYDPRGEISLAAVEKALELKVFYTVPNSFRTASSSVNQGIPVLKLAKRDPLARSLGQLAANFVEAHAAAGRRAG